MYILTHNLYFWSFILKCHISFHSRCTITFNDLDISQQQQFETKYSIYKMSVYGVDLFLNASEFSDSPKWRRGGASLGVAY